MGRTTVVRRHLPWRTCIKPDAAGKMHFRNLHHGAVRTREGTPSGPLAAGHGFCSAGSIPCHLIKPMKHHPNSVPLHQQISGKVGWALLWLLGIPLPVLLIAFLIKGG